MINKDFAEMKRIYSAPIKYDKTREGYYYFEANFSIKEFPLTNDEVSALDYSTALLQNLKGSKLFDQFENAINKMIEGYRVSKIIGKSERQLIQVEEPLKTGGNEWLEPLLRAIVNKQALQLVYARYGGQDKTHILSPYLVKEYRNRWYVVGYSDKAENILLMALDRIKNIEPTNQPYSPTGNFNPDDFFKYSFGITQIHGASAEKIVLSFTPAQAQYILAQPMHHSQTVMLENTEEVQVQLEVYITQELIMTVLSYGAQVTVLKPAHFRETIKELITKMSSHYK
jgi:predicted DNA-binding transcriptional regulator YafY